MFNCLFIKNIADIYTKLILLLFFKFMKKNVNLKPSQKYISIDIKYNTIIKK